MIDPVKLAALKRHLGGSAKPPRSPVTAKRVQKNLSIPLTDAERLKALATRDNLSQAALLIAALNAYEALHGKLA